MDSDVSERTRNFPCAFKVACHYHSGGAFAVWMNGNPLVRSSGNEEKLKEFLQRRERLALS
jgi:hypothetical protein